MKRSEIEGRIGDFLKSLQDLSGNKYSIACGILDIIEEEGMLPPNVEIIDEQTGQFNPRIVNKWEKE